MAKCWIFAMLILVFVVQCIVAYDLEMESWRKNMESRLLKLERENGQLKMKNEEQDKTIKLLIEQNNQSKEVVNEKEESSLELNTPLEGVAFYAYISSIHTSALEVKHVIVYDYVVTNRGNGYHGDDGIFIVPQTGVYVFTWTVVVQEGEYIELEIVLNGSPFGSIIADTVDPPASGDWDCSTGIAVKEVNAGDHVYIRTFYHDAHTIIYSGTKARTSFAGWQLL